MDVLLDIDLVAGRRHGIERALREAIRDGRLCAGTPLPSSRQLAAEIGVARGTVVDAYDQLVAEGFLVARTGARTVVAPVAGRPAAVPDVPAPAVPRVDLSVGAPDLSSFPVRDWLAAMRTVVRDGPADALDYAGGRGRPELHAALVDYLARARGVTAAPAQVVICSGVDHGLALLAAALPATGRDVVAMEDPCLDFQRQVVARAGLDIVSLPVDGDGADPAGMAASGADVAVVTPARQAILGATLAPDRRTALVAWAQETDGIIVEDDYDGELRYDRQPIGALQALDPSRVVYMGTTSKSLAPGLRLAWVIVPPGLVGAVQAVAPPHSPVSSLDQLTLAALIRSHAVDRHLRRMRGVYRRRRDRFVATLAARAPAARVDGVAAGLHALVRWPADGPGEDDVVTAATDRGIAVTPVGPLWHHLGGGTAGLLVGYGRPPAHDVRRCYEAFAELMADVTS